MTKRQFIFIIACFIQGSALYTMYYYHTIGNEAWISLICSILIGMLVVYLYSALCQAHPSSCLVKINEEVYGKIPGKIISFLYIYTFIVSCSMTMREVFVLACAWASNAGVRYFASVSTFTCISMYFFTLLLFLLLLPQIELKHLLPIGEHSGSEYVKSISLCTAMPFSELAVLMILVPELRDDKAKKGIWKQFVLGILAGSPFLIITVLRDTLVLGPLLNTFSYPSYEVIRLINYKMFSHIESLYGAFLIFLLFFKSAIIFYCITKAFTQIFDCQKNIVFTAFTVGLTMLCTQQLCTSNIALLEFVLNRIPYILLIVQVGLPLITLMISIIKNMVKCKAGGVKCG